jgi:hypothetical protein
MTFTGEMEVRTRSIVTAATLMVLGHEPLEVRRDYNGGQFRFPPSAEADLRRYLAAKLHAEQLIQNA